LQKIRTKVQVSDAKAREVAIADRSAKNMVPVADQGGAKYGTFRELPTDGATSKKRVGKH
jgi:hypothetical protein